MIVITADGSYIHVRHKPIVPCNGKHLMFTARYDVNIQVFIVRNCFSYFETYWRGRFFFSFVLRLRIRAGSRTKRQRVSSLDCCAVSTFPFWLLYLT